MNTWQLVLVIVAAWIVVAALLALLVGRMVKRAESEEIAGVRDDRVIKEPSPDIMSASSPLRLQP